MLVCPKCQNPLGQEAEECSLCGVILAKARAQERPIVARADLQNPTKKPSRRSSNAPAQWQQFLLPAFLLVLIGFAFITTLLLGRREKPQPESPSSFEISLDPENASKSKVAELIPEPPMPSLGISESQWTESGLQRLLDRQARSVENQNSEAFLATFHSQRQESARYLYDQLQLLPLTSFRLLAKSERANELLLQQWLEFDGMQDHPFLLTRSIEVTGEDGELKISRFGKADSFALWEHESIEVTHTNHFLIFTHPSRSAIRDEVVGVIESAWLALYQRYLPMAERYAAFVPGDPAYFGQISGDSLVAGVATWRYIGGETGSPRVINPSLYLNPALFQRGVNPKLRLQALKHEMVHLALSDDTHERTPNWLIEGSAVYFSGGYTQGGEVAKMGRALDRMSVQRKKVLSTVEEYAFAGAAVEYLVDGQGVHHFLAFYQSVKTDQGRIEGALARFYEITPAALDDQIKDWLTAMHRF